MTHYSHEISPIHLPNAGLHRAASAEGWGKFLLVSVIGLWLSSLYLSYTTVLSLLTLFGFAVTILGIRRPEISLYGIGLLCVLDPAIRAFLLNSEQNPLLRYNTFNYLLIGLLFIFLPLLLRLQNAPIRLLEFLVVIVFLELLPNFGVQGASIVMQLLAGLSIVTLVARVVPEHEYSWRWLFLLCGSTSALSSVIFYLSPPAYLDHNAAVQIPLAGLFSAYLGFRSPLTSQKLQRIFLLLALVNALSVFLSGSRGGLGIGAVIVFGFFLDLRRLDSRFGWIVIGILLFYLGAALFPETADQAISRLQKATNAEEYSLAQRTSSRSELAKGAWYIFLDNPLGVGTGQFSATWISMGDFDGRVKAGFVGKERIPHGAWFLVMSENGFLGLFYLTGFVFSLTFTGLSSKNRDIRVLGLIVGLAIGINYFHSNFQSKAIWLLIATAIVWLNRDEVRCAQTHPTSLLSGFR